MRWLILLFVTWGAAAPAQSESIVADLSQSRVSITTTFTGSEILVFGAIKRDAPVEVLDPPHVIVTVAGPSAPVTVRKKDRIAGIWVNAAEAQIDSAPSFY
ncbi:MAG: TIGR02186 family protein, partial [Pseudomonadota bacterium]